MRFNPFRRPPARWLACLLVASASAGANAVAQQSADEISVLTGDDHPRSPAYTPGFPDHMIPLDSRLSWTQRFLGDERFNPEVTLTAEMQSMAEPSEAAPTGVTNEPTQADATGVVRQVRPDQGKVKIEHGPIERLGMPGMTMVFGVADPALLDGLEPGREIAFDVDDSGGGFVVTRIAGPAASGPDGRGVVRDIRHGQGKIKLEHGPIERLGMPAMSMVFQVADPALLDGLDKGMPVEFTVDNSAGGFVITSIRQADEGGGGQ